MGYTEGDWVIDRVSYSGDVFIKDTEGKFIALVDKRYVHLLVTAPKLLEALRKIRAMTPETIIYDIANTALASAEPKEEK